MPWARKAAQMQSVRRLGSLTCGFGYGTETEKLRLLLCAHRHRPPHCPVVQRSGAKLSFALMAGFDSWALHTRPVQTILNELAAGTAVMCGVLAH